MILILLSRVKIVSGETEDIKFGESSDQADLQLQPDLQPPTDSRASHLSTRAHTLTCLLTVLSYFIWISTGGRQEDVFLNPREYIPLLVSNVQDGVTVYYIMAAPYNLIWKFGSLQSEGKTINNNFLFIFLLSLLRNRSVSSCLNSGPILYIKLTHTPLC